MLSSAAWFKTLACSNHAYSVNKLRKQHFTIIAGHLMKRSLLCTVFLPLHNSLRAATFAITLACICILVSIFASTTAIAYEKHTWATPITLPACENLFEVTPTLFRSAQPTAKALQTLEAFGIKTVINLRNNHTDDAEAKNTELVLHQVPINTWNINEDQIIEALAHIKTSPQPVLVHCMHGADRTGLVIAMYRVVEEGWSKEEALNELQNGGFGYHSVWSNIPKMLLNANIPAIKKKLDEKVMQETIVSF